ncbi:hypothetical protein Phum_PHUM027980 [Pediculus humanus corporis]|uniref:Uncharacterized protein n=1 Tax=Pediculus humanus subsp. corporis TaxID=121224 RepID=E0VA67_PEDHC|nr:uncharacterized protein Phum_PHUM027980 [Pediculus humanus corporis]EEB10273.1 hypothetical protein Phum_PHUM027980 [Pediculus humanus corporis]
MLRTHLPTVSPSQSSGLVPLQPFSAQPLTSNISNKTSNSLSTVGPTWSNSGGLNIDIDNLTISGNKLNNNKREPSMNQMAINKPASQNSTGLIMGGGSSINNMKNSNFFNSSNGL